MARSSRLRTLALFARTSISIGANITVRIGIWPGSNAPLQFYNSIELESKRLFSSPTLRNV